MAGLIAGAGTLAIVVYALVATDPGGYEYFADPGYFLDVGAAWLLSFGVHRRSRLAAVLLVSYFLISKILLAIDFGMAGSAVSLVLLYFFGRAVQGTFAYHRIRRSQDPSYNPVRRWMYFVIPPAIFLFVVVLAFGTATTLQLIPSTAVVAGDELPERDINTLIARMEFSLPGKRSYCSIRQVFSRFLPTAISSRRTESLLMRLMRGNYLATPHRSRRSRICPS